MVNGGIRKIDSFYDVPFIGPWPAKFGKIIELWDTSCTPSPELYVRAFWHAAPFLVWAVIKPDPIDLVIDRLRVPHHRKRKRRFIVDDVFKPKFPVPTGKITTAVFDMIKAEQKLGFYMLIVDASLDFVINWMSAAYVWEGCAVPDAAWARGRSDNTTHIFASGDIGPIGIWSDRSQNHFFADVNTMDCPVGYDVSCQVNLTYTTPPPGDPFHFDGTMNLVDYQEDWIVDSSTRTEMPDGSYLQQFTYQDWSATKPAHQFGIQLNCDHVSHINFHNSSIELYGTKMKGMKFDP